MKVLIADKFPDSGRRALSESGCEVVYDPDLKDEQVEYTEAELEAGVVK